MKSYDSLPRALILCKDSRLARLLETELAYLGVTARAADALSPSSEALCLLVADGDGFPVGGCAELAKQHGCPLLIFGRKDASLPSEIGVFLRRPFILTELEDILRRLLTGAAAVSSQKEPTLSPTARESAEAAPSPAALTAEAKTVTVAGNTVSLTPAEWDILHCLYTHRGETVPKEALASLLGGGGNSVEVYVCRLRAKIEKPLGRRLILTVRGVGYRMEPSLS